MNVRNFFIVLQKGRFLATLGMTRWVPETTGSGCHSKRSNQDVIPNECEESLKSICYKNPTLCGVTLHEATMYKNHRVRSIKNGGKIDMRDNLQELNSLYDLLRRLYLTEPDRELIDGLSAIKLPELGEGDEISEGLGLIVNSISIHASDLDQWLEALAEEYARLFIGPKSPVAVPFASFYLSDSKALMTDETLEVRKLYLEAGLSVQNLYRTPDDQIGIEIEFLYYLTDSMITTTDSKEFERLQSIYDRFYEGHFKKWVPHFATLVIEGSEQDFYRGAGYLLRGVANI